MDLLWTALIGLVVGVVAKFLMPGKDPGGIILTAVLGIGGAYLATFLGQFVKWYQPGEPAGFIAAVLGAMLILWVYRRFQQKKA